MGPLTLFGLFAVTAMVVFYALEHRSPGFILAFAGACVLGSVYGFLQGAWPFGLVEAAWSLVAVRRWWRERKPTEKTPPSSLPAPVGVEANSENAAQEIILNAIQTKGKAKRHDLLPLVKISKSSLVRLLDQMEAKGLIVQVGERKAAFYALPGPKEKAKSP